MFKYYYLFILLNAFSFSKTNAQSTITIDLTLEKTIQFAQEQSPSAMVARYQFLQNYWQYHTYVSRLLPSLSLTTVLPQLNRSISKVTLPDGSSQFVNINNLNSSVGLSLSQNIGLTGGNIFLSSQLQQNKNIGQVNGISFSSTPLINIGFQQPISRYNSFKWDKKIEPLKYAVAKKSYIDALEQINIRALNLFFDLALAQLNLNIARINLSNSDTLFKIAKGRYNIGTIAENDLLQVELGNLNSGTDVNRAIIDLETKKSQIRSFLGFNQKVEFKISLSSKISTLTLIYEKVIEDAKRNNPDYLSFEMQQISADRDVAQSKAQRYNASIYASFGLTQTANSLELAYKDPINQQTVQFGLQVPIIDWGLAKGKYKMAQNAREVIITKIMQSQADFEQNIFVQVMQFNLQNEQLSHVAKADTIARLRYEVTKNRFYIGKISVLDLNVALTEQDLAQRGYIEALRNYWNNYYYIRKLTLYDYEENKTLDYNFDDLIH